MRAAILGASGFIGGRTVEMFHLGELAEVRPVVRRVSSLAALARFDLDCRVADAFDEEALRAAFDGCDVVIHAVAGDARVILGTLAPVYHAAQRAGVRRLVYLSTASVHGQAPAAGTDEDSPLHERHPIPYNNAKVRAERALRALRRRGAVELVLLRPAVVVGPRSFWIGSFADAVLEGHAYLVERGAGVCNSIYVDNLVHALHRAMSNHAADGEAFLVGDREHVTWADLYRPVANALGVDLADLPEATLPNPSPPWRQRVEALRRAPPARTLAAVLPSQARTAVVAALGLQRSWLEDDVWALPSPAAPAASLEMAALYRARYKLPSAKAERLLGYAPPVPFADACRRTVAWLDFAGYPVVDAAPR